MTTQPEKTLRDEFAMAAMREALAHKSGVHPADINDKGREVIAEAAYAMADAMLAAREKGEQ